MTNFYEALAHEIWAAAQLAPCEGIVDGVDRIKAILRKTPHPAITHCKDCGCDWVDNGLNPIGCPYCEISALRKTAHPVTTRCDNCDTMSQPAESCESLISNKTACGSKNGNCDSQPDEPDLVRCAECGAELIPVRPGKWQHPDCSQSSWAAEPVKVPSDAELLTCTGVSKHGDMPAIFGTADIRRFAECILKHFGQRPAEPEK